MPALPPYLIEPIWELFVSPATPKRGQPPSGLPPPSIPDRVLFEKLLQVLLFGCAYRRIAEESSSPTTLLPRGEEWIEAGVMEALREIALLALRPIYRA